MSLLLLGSATAYSSPPGLFHPPRLEGGVPITGRSGEKYQKVQGHSKNASSTFRVIRRLWGLLGTCWRKYRERFEHKGTSNPQPSGFACLRDLQVPEFNGEIFTYSEKDSMTVFFEHIKYQDHYVRSILSDVKPMKTLTAEQQLKHAAATTCELWHGQFTKKNKKTKHHCHLSGYYIGPYCNTCNLKLK